MYESFYKLSARPFQLMPDPRLLFESRDHKRALSYLLYGLERGEGFVVITGGVGMGKTLLVQTLLGEKRMHNLPIARIAMANLNAEAVLPTVASAFGLPHKSRSKIELFDDLIARVLKVEANGALLIVDEAQSCTPEALEELRAISNLQAHGRALLQIFLVGQTDLREQLARPRMAHLRQRIVASHHLKPLDAEETRAYIEHRLSLVGWRDNPHFEDGVYDRVHAWSSGVPRRINLLMDRFLLFGYLEERSELTVDDLRLVIEEFEEEFESDELAFAAEAPPAAEVSQSPAADIDMGGLSQRMASLERALVASLGESRAGHLIDSHQADAQNRELATARMRLERLEQLFNEWTKKKAPEAGPTPTKPPSSSASETPVSAEHAKPNGQAQSASKPGATQPPESEAKDARHTFKPRPGAARAPAAKTEPAGGNPPTRPKQQPQPATAQKPTAGPARDDTKAKARPEPAAKTVPTDKPPVPERKPSPQGEKPARAAPSYVAEPPELGDPTPPAATPPGPERSENIQASLTEAVDAIAPGELAGGRDDRRNKNTSRRLFSRKKRDE